MEENQGSVTFIRVSKENVLAFLGKARRRVIIAKAGYLVEEITKLLCLADNHIHCDVYVDTDEKSIRYGFGEQAALELIHKNLERLNVRSANYIRMAIVIVDDTVMVYSPVALSWEEVPEQIDFPNGFIGGKELATSLLAQIEGKPIQIHIEGLEKTNSQQVPVAQKATLVTKQDTSNTITTLLEDINIQPCPVVQKAPAVIKQDISKTIAILKENPLVDPSKLRKTTIYRNKYKLLKMTVHGVKITNKSISLRPFNSMFKEKNLRLKSSWNVLTREDVESLTAIKDFWEILQIFNDECTFDAGRYGVLILTKDKTQLEKGIHCAVLNLKGCLGKIDNKTAESTPAPADRNAQDVETTANLLNKQVSEAVPASQEKQTDMAENSLAKLLKDSRTALVEHLFSQALQDKSCRGQLFSNDQTLYRQLWKNDISEEEAVRQAVETFVDFKLNFPKANEMIYLIHVEFNYYDISDELLAKNDFIEILQKFDIQVRDYQEGYEKNKQRSLFDS